MKSLSPFIGAAAALLLATAAQAASKPQCQSQVVQGSKIELCMNPGSGMQHDTYVLRADSVLIFALVDDYVEKVTLEHRIPEGLTIEFPLSKQGTPTVTLSGGCVPVSQGGAEVARVCNFTWGQHKIITDWRFEFD